MKEDPNVIAKYEKLEALGKKIFTNQTLSLETITKEHFELAKKFLAQSALEINPQVLSSYWEHILLSPNLGKRIAEKLETTEKSVNSNAIELLLFLHDIGRLITPPEYFRNDLIGDRLLLAIGFEKELIDALPPLGRISVLADEEEFNDQQLNFSELLKATQEKIIQKYFESLTPTQRIINLADNLGKRNADGIFSISSFKDYLKTQEKRYSGDSHWACIHWAIIRRRGAALFQYHLVKKTLNWLESEGVDVNQILADLKNYGPKFVLVIRHGELDNPSNLVYNRDSVMKTPIHLSTLGREHMQKVGELIKAKEFNLTKLFVSPETRTQESALELNKSLALPTETIDNLDDVFAPEPYLKGWSMNKLIALGGNVYNLPRTESPQSITQRMLKTFNAAAGSLKVGQTAILLSHGDPIVFLTHFLKTGSIPDPEILRKIVYPAKGQAMVTVIGPEEKIFTLYLLEEKTGISTY